MFSITKYWAGRLRLVPDAGGNAFGSRPACNIACDDAARADHCPVTNLDAGNGAGACTKFDAVSQGDATGKVNAGAKAAIISNCYVVAQCACQINRNMSTNPCAYANLAAGKNNRSFSDGGASRHMAKWVNQRWKMNIVSVCQ